MTESPSVREFETVVVASEMKALLDLIHLRIPLAATVLVAKYGIVAVTLVMPRVLLDLVLPKPAAKGLVSANVALQL